MSAAWGTIGLVLLSEVAETSAAVARVPGRRDKVAAIAGLLARVPDDEVPVAVAFLSGTPLQRQLGVGYAALADLVPGAWAEPALAASGDPDVRTTGDSGGEASRATGGELTLTAVNGVFAELGAAAGDGVQARRRSLLAGLLSRASADERGFLVRLIAGDLGQGAGEGIMLDAVASAAGVPAAEVRRAHQLAGWLPEVARAVLDPDVSRAGRVAVLRRFTLLPGRPVRPMLAASAPSLAAALDRISPAAVEWKIDGVRIQIHVADGQVGVYTRTLDDITGRVPEIVALAGALGLAQAVIDGEAVALRPDGRPRPFQLTSARVASRRPSLAAESGPRAGQARDAAPASGGKAGARQRPGPATDASGAGAGPAPAPLSAFLFDLLHADGEDLMERPAAERFDRLAAIAPPTALIPRLVTGDLALAEEFLADALRRGHEGVVVKSLDAPYQTGRRGGEWIKVKPRETLDLVILAAEWGHGRRTGWLSNLHLGARDPTTGGFVMLGKTFKGLTDAMLAWQTERLLELAVPDPGQPAGRPPERRPYGVVRVRPELVAEIAFDGVQASSRYPGGVTLRFARVLRYRDDKTAADADTIDAVRSLWQRRRAMSATHLGDMTPEWADAGSSTVRLARKDGHADRMA